MVTFSQQVIQEARDGSFHQMNYIGQHLTMDNYDVSILDAALVHLQAERLPKFPIHFASLDIFNRGILSISLINAILRRLPPTQMNKEQAVSRILENFEDLMVWILAYLRSIIKPLPPGVITYSSSLLDRTRSLNRHIAGVCDLVELDPRVKNAFLDSPKGLRVVLTLWSFRELDGSGDLLLPDPEGFPIIYLWGLFIVGQLDTENLDRIFGGILSTKFELTRFCNAFLDRIRQMPLLPLQDPPPNPNVRDPTRKGYPIQTLRTIYTLSFNILERVSSHPVIQAILRRSNYLSVCAKSLIAMHPSILQEDALSYCYTLHRFAASEGAANPVSGAVKVVSEPGLVSLILDGLLNTVWEEDEEMNAGSSCRMGEYIIGQWTGFALYPRFVQALSAVLLQQDRKVVDSVMKLARIGRDWTKLVENLRDRLAFLESDLTVHICDNFQVGRFVKTDRTSLLQRGQC